MTTEKIEVAAMQARSREIQFLSKIPQKTVLDSLLLIVVLLNMPMAAEIAIVTRYID